MPNDKETYTELYKSILETWRSQVDSYWQRSNYFAAFETAAIAGCWHLHETTKARTVVVVSVLGVLLTVIWLLSNSATHSYVLYWWNALAKTEKKLPVEAGFDFVTQHPGSGGLVPYSWLIQLVPIIFAIAWLCLLGLGIDALCEMYRR